MTFSEGELKQRIHELERALEEFKRTKAAGNLAEAEALLISQARIAGIVGISEDAIISLDREQRITLFNAGAEKIFGFSAAEVMRQSIDMLIPERFREVHRRQVHNFMSSPDTLRSMNERGDIFGLRKDGSEFPAEASISKFEIAGEMILAVRLRDITDRKRAAEELKARARQQETVARIGARALRGGDLASLMQEACAMVAETLEAEYAKVLELLPTRDALLLKAGVGWNPGLIGKRIISAGIGSHAGYTLLSAEPVVVEDLRTERRFSEPLLQEHGIISGISVIIAGSEAPYGVLGFHTGARRTFSADDINFLSAVANVLATAIDRNRMDEALRQSTETLRVVNRASPLAMWALDLSGKILFWNPAAEALLGWSEQEVLGLPHPAIPDDEKANFEALLNQCRSGQSLSGFETRRRKRDGSIVEVSLWSAPLRNPAGEVSGTLIIAADITERKRFEEQLRQAQKLESIGLLAGGVAHDFNNLLTGIMGNVSLAMDIVRDNMPARELLERSLAASERAADLIKQLLAYAGKGRFVLQPVNLSEAVRELLPLIRSSIPRKVRLELKLDETLPPIQADPGQMQQLVMNLVINGGEAIGDAAGVVTVATGVKDVDERYLREVFLTDLPGGKYICLQVSDNGAGMDEETKAQIFDPFFTTKFTGRGLGLAAVFGIVRGHKGALRVDSAPGRGSTFELLLPAGEVQRTVRRRSASKLDITGAGTVLVVDDEEVVRSTAKAALERYGYSVLVAESGQEALELFESKREQTSLVLLDMSMPIMSGEEVLERLKRVRPNLCVVVSSGYNESEAIRRFAGMDVAAFIQKPYTSEQLAAKIKAVLNRHP